jgi:hypothetical protein
VGRHLAVCEHHSIMELLELQLEGTCPLQCQQATSGLVLVDVNLCTAVQRFQACLPRIWRMPWDNRYKEALWHLGVNRVPGADGYGIVHRSACLCGWLPPTLLSPQVAVLLRHHAFWDCPVTCTVRKHLNQTLPPGRPRLTSEANFWVVQAHPGVHQPVWDMVDPAALSANSSGCRSEHHVVPPLPCPFTASPGHTAILRGWLHTSYISLLAESSQLC